MTRELARILLPSLLSILFAAPALAQQADPADPFKPGLRLTYYLGSAQLPGPDKEWKPDPDGNWVDPDGKRWTQDAQASGGGYGLLQFNVVGVDEKKVAIETRSYQINDPAKNTYVLGAVSGGIAPRGSAVEDLWTDPRELAKLPEKRTGEGQHVSRLKYKLGEKTYNAIRIQAPKADGLWSQTTYDLDTGLLLVLTSQSQGAQRPVVGPNGTVVPGRGVMTLVITYFLSARQLALPWAGTGAPQWLGQTKGLSYGGEIASYLEGSEFQMPPTPLSSTVSLEPSGSMALFHERIQNGAVADITNVTERTRVSGSGGIGQLWLPPAELVQGQVIDEDPHTRVRVFVEEVGQRIIITETGPVATARYVYDPTSRMLIGAQNISQTPTGRWTATLQLQGRR